MGTSYSFGIALSVGLLFSISAPAEVQSPLEQLRSQFERESDPVRKAKSLHKLGDAQFAQARKELDAGETAQALRFLTEYRDDVKKAHTALKASGRDAERKPAGFKTLEIHVRESVLRLGDIILSLPPDDRAPFEAVRRDLDAVDRELIDALFPRQPGKMSSDGKPRGPGHR